MWTRYLDVKRKNQLSPRAISSPSPIAVAVSQDFDGPDGLWSSFVIQVGSPAQTLKVLISTASYQTWFVLPQGCTSTDPSNCEITRGGIFRPDQSHTWTKNNVTANGMFSFRLESNLGYNSDAEYGYDTVTLGWKGSGRPTLQHQVVAGVEEIDFWMGLFGINPRPSNFTDYDITVPSFMFSLKNESLIPSLTYGYTPGNQYRLNKVFASLTLGGYDSSRFISNNVSFPFDQIDDRDLTVTINSVTVTAGGINTSLMSTSIHALIDSTIPYISLPLAVCKKFEEAFGLTFNNDVQGYLVNDTLHQKLIDQNFSVTFTLGNFNKTETVEISLPYAAFDLIADYPLMRNQSRYFPLMRAENDSQHILGRTFLQEAYLIADYELFRFSISQCDWGAASQQPSLVPISPVSSHVPQTHRRVLAGVIVGAVLGGIIAILLSFAVWYHGYPRIKARVAVQDDPAKPEIDGLPQETRPEMGSCLDPELDSRPNFGAELEGEHNSRYEAQDEQNWVLELPGKGRHSATCEADCKQNLVPEMPANY